MSAPLTAEQMLTSIEHAKNALARSNAVVADMRAHGNDPENIRLVEESAAELADAIRTAETNLRNALEAAIRS